MAAGAAPAQVLALFARLGAELGAILDSALDVDLAGGTSDEWQATLARLGVEPLGEEARFEAAQAERQLKGPPIVEVGTCLLTAAAAIGPALSDLPLDQKAQVQRAVASLAEAALAQYRAQATERKKGMFAHARAAAQKHAWDAIGKSQGYVLKCASCGAPRLTVDLSCAFCGARI